MGVDDVFDYVMETPGNTNPNVLRSLLNNLDSGGSSGGGILVVNVSDGALDKKYSEILASTMPVVIHHASEGASYWGFVTESYENNGAYLIGAIGSDDGELYANYYVTDSADGYPEIQAGLPDGGQDNMNAS